MTNPKTRDQQPTRDEDEVLRRMLATKPTPHKPKMLPVPAKKTRKSAP